MSSPQLSQLFEEAVALSPEDRVPYLDRVCKGDAPLRAELERLLAADDRAKKGGFMRNPAFQWSSSTDTSSPIVFPAGEKIADRFRIIRFLGEGGMGQVYQAKDEVLNCFVALKTIRPEVALDHSTVERFKKEVKLAHEVADENVCRVFDLDHRNLPPFLTMEFIEGETLAARLRRTEGKRMTAAEALPLIEQMAQGLHAAHQKGVIHGDFKPGNVMLTETSGGRPRAKITDFGLARTNDGEGSVSSAHPAGTPSYMAPEQLAGGKATVASDIYALGLVMYEMVTGIKPEFDRMTEPAPPPSKQTPGLDPNLDAVILRCLARDPAERFHTAADVLQSIQGYGVRGLRWPFWANIAAFIVLMLLGIVIVLKLAEWSSPPAQPIQSLAVLPLENLSGDAERDYFADGITEALITNLAKVRALRVISRTSVMKYKGTRISLPEIAHQLRVDAVVEGSLLWVGKRVRITAHLIDARTAQHLWADSYERDLRDIMTLQNEISRAIAMEIKIKLTPQEVAQLSTAHPLAPEVYQDYLKGRYYWNKRTEEGVGKSIQYFTMALGKDPKCGPAFVGLAESYVLGIDGLPPNNSMQLAKNAATRALEIDDSAAEAHISLAAVSLLHDWDWPRAEREFKRGLELNPGYATAHHWYAFYLEAMGDFEGAISEIQRAQELDPLSLIINLDLARMFQVARRYDQAFEQCRKTLEMDANFAPTHVRLGQLYEQRGDYEKATAEFQTALALDSRSTRILAGLARIRALSGRKTEAQSILVALMERSRHGYVPAHFFAYVYLGLRDDDQAFAWLEKAYRERSDALAYLKVDPIFDSVRADPRLQSLMQRVGLPP